MTQATIPESITLPGAAGALSSSTDAGLALWRMDRLGLLGLCGGAVFGAAAGVGYGAQAMLRGALCAPVLFLGGAALSLPPLYLATALSDGKGSAAEILSRVTASLSRVGLVLLGLGAPAAYFSVTLRTGNAAPLLFLTLAILGSAGILGVTRATLDAERGPRTQQAAVLWLGFALLLGLRMIMSLRHTAGLTGQVWS